MHYDPLSGIAYDKEEERIFRAVFIILSINYNPVLNLTFIMEELLAFLNSIAIAEGSRLSEACLSYLRSVIKEMTLNKKEHLLRPGQICRNIYFIKEGLLKCYYILHDEEVSDWFFGEGETVVSVDSFYDQIIGDDYIQALEKTKLLYIRYEHLTHLYRTYVEFNVIGRVLTNKYLRIWHRQMRDNRRLTAEERYNMLLERNPSFIKRVPVQDLASFLNMKRETLSRMRNKATK